MSKDSYWFRHDSTAGRGLRMRKMAHIHGHWGKGVYWDVIEILRDQANYCFDYDDSSLQMLADLIGCKDEAMFMTWMRDCVKLNLFEVSENKFFSAILCENMSKWETKKRNGSEPKAKRQAKRKDKIIEDKRTEEEIIKTVIIFNQFYDSEIEKSGNDENYIKFVKVLFGENPLSKPLDRVLKMRDQLSFEQFKHLWRIKEKTNCVITDVLVKMENWKDLTKRVTVLETFRTFATPKEK